MSADPNGERPEIQTPIQRVGDVIAQNENLIAIAERLDVIIWLLDRLTERE